MIDPKRLRKEIEIPEKVEVVIGETITIKGEKGENSKKLFYPTVEISKKDNKIVIEPKKFTKREKKIINTYVAHLNNMIKGVQEPYTYKVKVCSSHFPMSVSVNGNELVVKNFYGEKVPRRAAIVEGVNVKVNGEEIVLVGTNKESVGQTAANFEKSTRITNRDRRIFQDGLWITEKGK
tara:strand:- start:3980 stop:4516 length:537 start_codon:yes stop_codon:yes gene_type:complete